jgi:hypothetical protein
MQSLAFTLDSFELLELDSHLCADIHSLVFKGLEKDSAVLTSHQQTFQIRRVYTSNTLLIVSDQGQVSKSLDSYYELCPVRPKVDRMKQWLEKVPYCGPIEETRMMVLNVIFMIQFRNLA